MTAATATETRSFTVEELVVSVKTGTGKNGKPWTRYGAILEGDDTTAVWGGTFDAGTGGQLQTLKGKGATLTAEKDGDFWNITNVEPTGPTTTTTTTKADTTPDVFEQLKKIAMSSPAIAALIEKGEIKTFQELKIATIDYANTMYTAPTPATTDKEIPF